MSAAAPNRARIKSLHNLVNAIRTGDKHYVIRILDSGQCDVTDPHLRALPLHAACAGNSLDIVKGLISRGAHVSAFNRSLRPFQSDPLLVACASILEKTNIIQCLIDAGCDVNARDIHGWTSLHWACARGSASNVRILIEAGANVNLITGDYLTALELASYGSNPELIRLLLKAGADLSKKAGDYISNCIAYKCTEGVELLYMACPGTTIRNPKAFQGKMGQYLKRTSLMDPDPDTDFSMEQFQRVSVLHAVCSVSFDPHLMLRRILKIGADLRQRDQYGLSSLQYLCSNLHVQSVQVMFDFGANPEHHSWSPLWACFPIVTKDNAERYLSLLKLLHQAGFNMDRESVIEFTESVKRSELPRKNKVQFLLFLREAFTMPRRLTSLCRKKIWQLLPCDVSVSSQRLANEIPDTMLHFLQNSDVRDLSNSETNKEQSDA